MSTKRNTGKAGAPAKAGQGGKGGKGTVKSPPSRLVLLGVGALLGFAWGSIMWGIAELLGRDSGLRGWIYIAFTVAMLGAGVAAIFGTFGARRRGERVMPRFRRKKT